MSQYIESFPEDSGSKKTMLSKEPTIHPSCTVKKSRLGEWTALGAHTTLNEVEFGDYSYTAGHVHIAYATIGKFCSIANSTRINPGNHPQWRVTQHHFTYRRIQYGFDTAEDEAFFQWRREHHCHIGHDVWIGHGAVIMPGIKIGIGAIIGAGAVVTKDVGSYEIAVGVPARVIKKRFPDEVVEKLLQIAWWEWDRTTLEESFHDLLDMDTFLQKYAPINT